MKFIKYLIKENIGKSIMICLLGLISWLYTVTPTQGISYTDPIVSEFKLDNSFCYITKSDNRLDLWTYVQPPKIVNGRIMVVSEYVFRTLEIIIGIIILIVIVVCSLSDEAGWDIIDVRAKAAISKVRVNEENGYWHFSYKGKLLCKTDHIMDSAYRHRMVLRALEDYFMSSPNLYDDYISLKESRDNKLNKLV